LVCPQCGERNPPRFRFCGSCATRLSAPPRETRKLVSAIFCDLVGSTEMGERLDAESVKQVQTRYYAEMRRAIEGHGGWVEKYIGDAVVGIFGVPILHEDDALRAVSAAAEMRERIGALNAELERDWGTRLRTRIGVNTGEAVAEREVFLSQVFVAGDAMNVAARLEQAAGPGEILLGHQTYGLVRDSVQVVPVEPLTLKGKREPVPAWRLLKITVPHGRKREFDSPLVSRDRELARLTESLVETRRAGAARVVTILGSAGVGKSRLVHEFVSSLRGTATVLQGRCLPYGEGITFWPIAEVIKQACGITQEDSAEESRAKIAERLPESEVRSLVCERIAGVLGLGEAESATVESFWAIRKLLEALAHPRPLVVVLDDIHWAEDTLLDLVGYLATQTLQAPILLVCLSRPDLLEQRPEWTAELTNASTFTLEPLGPADSARLIENLLGGEPLREKASRHLTDAAAGNPLFLEELVRMLVDEGLLRQEDGTWVAATDLSAIAVPPTLRALLGARLERLDPDERQALEAASVIGKEFARDAVADLLPPPARRDLSGRLEMLVRGGFVRAEGGDEFLFHHILIRDVAYESMPKRARAELHERYADRLEAQAGERLTEYEVIVGYHLEQAFRLREQLGPVGAETQALGVRAGRRLASGGGGASRRGDVAGAVNLLRRALELLPDDDPDTHEVMLDLGISLLHAGHVAESEEFLTRAVEVAVARRDLRIESYARIERSGLEVDIHPELGPDSLRREAEKALPVFEALGDDVGLAKTWRRLATMDGVGCRWGAAGEAFERARTHARRAADGREEALASALIFQSLVRGPTPVETGITRCEELLHEGGRHRGVEAVGLAALANLQAMVGRFDDARRLLVRSDAILEDLGQTRRMLETAFLAAETEMLAGDPAAAERKLAWAYETVKPSGFKGYLASLAAALAEPLAALGRYDEAEELTALSEATAGADDADSQVKWRQVRAKIRAHRGDFDAAEAFGREAVRRAEATDALNMRGGALVDLAEVLGLADRFEAAHTAALQAVDIYARKGNRVAEENTRALRARLPGHGAAVRGIGA
jgi:class 3 adenylate cyclase/tetratricopeptide (TPR) repeat protein